MNADEKRFLEQVGLRVRERRTAASLTQAELGDQCGLHRTYLSDIERGEQKSAVSRLRKLAKALRTTLAALVGSGVSRRVIRVFGWLHLRWDIGFTAGRHDQPFLGTN